ncbi:MAG TPA: response regulator [Kribbellaceae bacterium]|nr:response regulator [Kribbellaceae bacterium]
MTTHPPVLLAEDDESHVHLVRRFLVKGGLVNPIHAVRDGAEAVAYINGEGRYADRSEYPLPAVVITDLNLAGTGGLEVLRAVRSDERLKDLPVVVMSGSTQDEDVGAVHRLGASAYLVKPVAFEALLDVIRRLGMPWALQRRDPRSAG